MKELTFFLCVTILLCFNTFIVSGQQQSEVFPKLTGSYLGQTPPGMTPELFAPGIIALGYQEQKIAISPDGSEIYFSVVGVDSPTLQILFTQLKDGVWTMPQVAPFSNEDINIHPAFSPDGTKLFFISTRKTNKNNPKQANMDIWCVERKDDIWSEPINMGSNINSEMQEACPSAMADGTLFFETNSGPDPKDWNINVSYLKDGIYQKPEKIPSPISMEYNEGGPCISPDGSYLLFFSNRPGTIGAADLYIVYKKKNGSWSEALNLGNKVNSKYIDRTPVITPDGKYLIFTSSRNIEPITPTNCAYTENLKRTFGTPKPGNGTLYWVSAKIIEELKPNLLK